MSSEMTFEECLKESQTAIKNGDKDKHIEYLLKAYELNPIGRIMFYIFVFYVSVSDYENALDWLIKLYNTKKYTNDTYTYFLLLSNFVSIPDEIGEELDKLTFKDIRISYEDTRFNDTTLNNNARDAILNLKYKEAFNYMLTVQKNRTFCEQEYVIFRLLNDKAYKYHRKCKTWIKELKIYELYTYLNNIRYRSYYENILLDLTYLMYDSLDGIILNKRGNKSTNLTDALNNHDFEAIKKYALGIDLICLLVDKIVLQNQKNIENKAKGDMGYYFYDTLYNVLIALNNHDYIQTKNIIREYLNTINLPYYKNFMSKIIDLYELLGDDSLNISEILLDLSRNKPYVDVDYLKKIFGRNIRNNKFDICEKILIILNALPVTNELKNSIEFMQHVYNYQKYKFDGTIYDGLDDDLELYKNIDDIHENILNNRQIERIDASSIIEEKKIRNRINSYFDLAYIKIENEDDTCSFYIKKQNACKHFRRDEILYKAKHFINIKDYDMAEKILLHGLTLINRFDYSIISLLAYIYKEKQDIARYNKMVEVLDLVCGIDDYNEVINGTELALVDLDQNYYYQINNIELIIDELIQTIENESSTSEAIQIDANFKKIMEKYNVLNSDIPYVYALTARELYKVKNYVCGDIFYELADVFEIDDNEFKRLLTEIKTNKLYYSIKCNDNFISILRKTLNKTAE